MTNFDSSYDRDYESQASESRSYGDTGDWLLGTVRRNPEAFLVLAAGAALLLRGGARAYRGRPAMERYRGSSMEVYRDDSTAENGGRRRGRMRAVRESLSDVAETAGEYASEVGEYASDVKDRVYDTASAYASAASSYVEGGRRRLVRQASRLGSQASEFGYQTRAAAGQMVHEQPLAVAALGLAAGAAVAALLPRTDMERRAFRPARDALADAASRAAGTVREAAGETARRLQEEAVERGLSPEGLKEMARDAAETFTGRIASGSDDTVVSKTGTGASGGSAGGGSGTPAGGGGP